MILKKASAVEITPTYDGTKETVYKHVEKCGRICYKSEDRITDGSAEKFVNMLIDKGHTAMIAENKQREITGDSMAYTEKDFMSLIERYGIHHNAFPFYKG